MKTLRFHKYQATGNDFVVFDNRNGTCNPSIDWIARICDRRKGIGGDGIILLESHPEVDFKVIYYNKDGSQSLCGNGCRAAVSLASQLNIIEHEALFLANDGTHWAEMLKDNRVRLKMKDVSQIQPYHNDMSIDTGSPHYIRLVKKLNDYDVFGEGQKIRYSKSFHPHGINVNFVELLKDNTIALRTYERGVEGETPSCGTGAVAAALAAAFKGYFSPMAVCVRSDTITVEFNMHANKTFSDIFLTGAVKNVFEGVIPY